MSKILSTTLAASALALAVWASSPGASADDAVAGPRLFDSPDAAIQAAAAALKANDDDALRAILGPESDDLVLSGKDPFVARERRRVAKAIAEKVAWETREDGLTVAVLGAKEWPMPIPLAQKDGKWHFDAEAGREELLARRIGKNELQVIDLMRTLVQAQEAYRSRDRDGDGTLEYARKFVSSPEAKDGLFWVDPEGVAIEDRSPLGALIEELAPRVEGESKGAPFSGYHFKMLTAQGRCAPGGECCFLCGEDLARGFAVVAVPAEYGNSGVKSFIVSHHGRVLEKDLGPDGAEVVKSMTVFQPDATWTRVGDP